MNKLVSNYNTQPVLLRPSSTSRPLLSALPLFCSDQRRRICAVLTSAPVPMGATPAAGELIPGNHGRRAGELDLSAMELLQVREAATAGPSQPGGTPWLRCGGDPLLEL
jgi:hypothetical protein